MELWVILQFAFALVAVIACIALTLEGLNAIDRAEAQAWQRQLREKVTAIR